MSLIRSVKSNAIKPSLFDVTGGVHWHLRALVSHNALWAPFKLALADELSRWTPQADKLLLIGPSAGWCIPDALLARFGEIHGLDIDRSAEFLFRRLHGRALQGRRLTWDCADFFSAPQRILAAFSDHAILLCNIAGQRRFHHPHWRSAETELAALQNVLAGRYWASFHDLLSGGLARSLSPPPLSLPMRTDGADVLRQCGLSGEWFDHLTSFLLPAVAPRVILPWRFKRDRLHLVEAGWSEPLL